MHIVNKEQEGEVWKSPPSLGRWWVEVSNMGRVRTLDRYVDYVRKDNGKRHDFRRGHILKISGDSRGRPMYTYVGGGRLVRDLVAECFVPRNNPAERFVFHKDGDVRNCRADNLCWGSSRSEHHISGRIVVAIRDGEEKPYIKGGLTWVAKHIGVTKQAIHKAIQEGRRCGGILVKYSDGTKEVFVGKDEFPPELYK